MQCFTALHIQGHLKNTYHLNIDVLGRDSSAQAITSQPRTSMCYVIRNKIWPPDEMVVTAAHSIEKMSNKDFKTVANSENLVTIRQSAVAFHRWSPTTSVFKYKTHPYMRFVVGDKGWSPTPEVAHSSFCCTVDGFNFVGHQFSWFSLRVRSTNSSTHKIVIFCRNHERKYNTHKF